MHPVIAKLCMADRRALVDHPDFRRLSDTRKDQLLDEVVKVRASLDHDDKLDAFGNQDQRMADAAKLKGAINTVLTVLSQDRQIKAALIEGLADYHRGSIDDAMFELRASKEAMGRLLALAERLELEPQDDQQRRTRRNNSEARLLQWVLADFDVKFVLTTPGKHGVRNLGFELIGLLADPPATSDVVRYRLRC
jgi:hypothetical protein